MHKQNNLNGLRVLNTRPAPQAVSLAHAIEQAGGVSVNLPLLHIEPTHNTWTQQLPTLGNTHAIIFTSPNAVQYFFTEVAPNHLPSTPHVLALGQGTATKLKHYGFSTPILPIKADSEHLVMLDVLQHIKHQTILLIKGEHGRDHIEKTLTERGAHVHTLNVYRRVSVQHDPQHIKTLWHEDAVDIILITSETALNTLFHLFGEEAKPWLCQKPYLVISERLSHIAYKHKIQTVMVSPYEHVINTLWGYTNKI